MGAFINLGIVLKSLHVPKGTTTMYYGKDTTVITFIACLSYQSTDCRRGTGQRTCENKQKQMAYQ